jgi:nitrogenase molybdenum-iron protein alpha/beta subunit
MFGISFKEIFLKKIAKKFLPMIPEKGLEAEKEFVKYINSFPLQENEKSVIAVAYPDKAGRIHLAIMSLNEQSQIIRALQTFKLDDIYQQLKDPAILENPILKAYLDKIDIE